MNTQLHRYKVYRLWLAQFGLAIGIAFVCAWFYSYNAAFSALLGGAVAIIPNVFFAILLFKHQGARAARKIVRGFYAGESLKIILTMAMFAVIFITCTITPLAFFMVYILVYITNWFTPWIIENKQNRPESD